MIINQNKIIKSYKKNLIFAYNHFKISAEMLEAEIHK